MSSIRKVTLLPATTSDLYTHPKKECNLRIGSPLPPYNLRIRFHLATFSSHKLERISIAAALTVPHTCSPLNNSVRIDQTSS